MNLIEILEACLKLGAPMAILSWGIFSWLHSKGKLDIRADRKAISTELKQMRKNEKKQRAEAKKGKKNENDFSNFLQLRDSKPSQAEENAEMLYGRWMWFGGGFYGLAALWTFAVVEVLDILGFIYNFPGFAKLFEHGVWSLVGDLIANQIMNIVSAFVWFNYWSGSSPVWLWFVVAYLGYLLGMELAKRQIKE